ncbi:MAG TPA: hypothetical protein PLG88_04565, partial [Chitinophagaceae bacterium]|nr:hypothetical protein [Chitinophagaceae bacterium]
MNVNSSVLQLFCFKWRNIGYSSMNGWHKKTKIGAEKLAFENGILRITLHRFVENKTTDFA